MGYEKRVTEFLKMMKCAEMMAKFHRCTVIITMGDFNARLLSWDKKTNTYCEILTNNLNWEGFTIITAETPTFIAVNGCSKINFILISSNLTVKIANSQTWPTLLRLHRRGDKLLYGVIHSEKSRSSKTQVKSCNNVKGS